MIKVPTNFNDKLICMNIDINFQSVFQLFAKMR